MGDLRNKVAKIEEAARAKVAGEAWLRRAGIASARRSHQVEPRCACGLTAFETQIWQCDSDGLFCRVCMPPEWKQVLFGRMVNHGVPFDADEHGEK